MNSPGDGLKADDLKLKVWRPRLQVIWLTHLNGEPVFVYRNLDDIIRTPAVYVKPFIYKDLVMLLQSQPAPRFIRRTSLGPNEYRKNFRQIDLEIIEAVTAPEADRVTPLMSKIYLRLVSAPAEFWDGEGVLYITARGGQERTVKASKVLYELLGVGSATAHKALAWMHERGIIGYSSGKNGVGIRIFLNRAAGSIGVRGSAAGEKNFTLRPWLKRHVA